LTDGTLLIVDDDPDILETMRLVLEACGYRVIAAREGQSALDLLRGGARPALIVLDLMMPGMDGWTLLSELQRDAGLPAIPVVVLSGDTDAVRRAASLEVAAALCKPLDVDTLLAAVERHRVHGYRKAGG
jgi:CheY-like chemotaxis protein